MKISAINTFNKIKNINFSKPTSTPVAFKQGMDIFTKESKYIGVDLPSKILSKRKFEISDYKSLSTELGKSIFENEDLDKENRELKKEIQNLKEEIKKISEEKNKCNFPITYLWKNN